MPCAVGRAVSSISWTKVSMLVPVAASDFATDSVEGQRGRPSGVMRFDLLKVVGSSPACLARPDAERPARAARRSRAPQICAWVNIKEVSFFLRNARDLVRYIVILPDALLLPATD